MPEFRIIESLPAIQYWEYIIEAENEEAAVDRVVNENIIPTEMWSEILEGDSIFEVYRSDSE